MLDQNEALSKIREDSMTKSAKKFRDNFAHDEWNGNFKLTADGCFQRHSLSRDEQMQTDDETRSGEFSYRNHAEYEDSLIINQMARGHRMNEGESNEEFLTRCKETEENK